MNKKLFLPLLAIALLVAFTIIGILQYRSQKITVFQTVPVIPAPATPRATRPTAEITQMPGVPPQTDVTAVTKQVANEVSLAEVNKVLDSLPIREENFLTSAGINTTINIYSFQFDPPSVLRIEIYGPNFNISDLTGPNATAFKESFLEAKRQLAAHGVILKNLQILYGNRQYIQDTATYWVKSFNLLD